MNLDAVAEAILAIAFVVSLWPRPHARMTRSYLTPVLGTLAASALSAIARPLPMPWHAILPDLALLALFFQPFFLLRLVSVLQPVSRRWLWGVGVCTVAIVLLAVLTPEIPPHVKGFSDAVLVTFLIGVEGYGALRLGVASRRSVGAARQRAALLAWASLGVAGLLLLDTVSAVFHWHLATAGTGGVAALIALGYLVAVAPPLWLRHAWQMPVLYQFFERTNAPEDQTETRLATALVHLAVQVVGGVAGGVLWRDPDRARYHRRAAERLPVTAPDGGPVVFEVPEDDVLERVWQEGTAQVAQAQADLSHVVGPDVGDLHALRRVLVVPVRAGDEMLCVVRVFTPLHGLFLQDDSALLEALAAYAGARMKNARALRREIEVSRRLRDANRALEAANVAKSDFLSGMSHELRTPLNAVIGFSDLLLQRRAGALTERQARYVGNILESGQHLLQIVNDVLDIAKADAARLDVRPAAVRLGGVVEAALLLVRAQAEAGGVVLQDDTDPDLRLWADELRVRQVLVNLLSNAVKFTPAGGHVTVRACRQDDVITVAVADTGIGIDAKHIASVFDEFTQVSHGTDRAYEGTGLGLPLVRRLTQAMGGGVRADSTPGVGSVFTVWFPPAVTEPLRAARLAGPATASERLPVLVIDDDRLVRELCVQVLGDAGYDVQAVGSLGAAQDAMRARPPRVILLDILLDGESGDGLFAAVSAVRPPPRIVVISILDTGRHPVPADVRDWLVKPVRPDQLTAAVARALADGDEEGTGSDG